MEEEEDDDDDYDDDEIVQFGSLYVTSCCIVL
jgi:hypothetical protein